MKFAFLKMTVGAVALATANVATAQHAGHDMTPPAAKKPAAKKPAKKRPAKKPAAKKPAAKKPAAEAATPAPPPVDHGAMEQEEPPPAQAAAPVDHGQHHEPAPIPEPAPAAHDHSGMAPGTAATGHIMEMTGALGPYPLAREASGTDWQPDSSEHGGIHLASGEWSFMVHGHLDLVHSWQERPRGRSKTFPAGMLMGVARRPLGDGTLQFRAMLSPDPLMGKRGYPLLLASGETADGLEPLVDRQHPHDFFMELSASISQNIGANGSLFLYAGLPGAPAFGPPAFMHRQSINASPEAPITHHWLDSTHIAFGVLTAGVVVDRLKAEASRFNGREPDQHRWNIETGPLDSTAIRLSWNPIDTISLQGSWAHLEDPEQLEPGVEQRRWSASGTYTRAMAKGFWSTSLAWGRKTVEGDDFDAFALESSVKWRDWTLFGRGELAENNELVAHHDEDIGDHHRETFKVGKISLGLLREFALAPHLKLGVGGLYAFSFVPGEIEPIYGGEPNGAMAFVRLKVD